MDDFFGKDGIFARLFAKTIEQMLEAEMSEHLGYEPYEAKGRNSGNNRNGSYARKGRTSTGEVEIEVPRDRNGEFEPKLLRKYATSSNELEDKIVALYAKGMSTRTLKGKGFAVFFDHIDHRSKPNLTDRRAISCSRSDG